jgi:hypothetical protein
MKHHNPKPGTLQKLNIFMEKLWMVVAIVALLIVCYFFVVDGVNRTTLSFLVFPALAGIMYGFRYTFRRRLEGHHKK